MKFKTLIMNCFKVSNVSYFKQFFLSIHFHINTFIRISFQNIFAFNTLRSTSRRIGEKKHWLNSLLQICLTDKITDTE